MNGVAIRVGFIPLVDAAPLIVAQVLGFAAEEGIALDLMRAPSWSALRDLLVHDRIEAAHMLAPMPVAVAMGQGGGAARLDVLSVLSLNGTVIGVSGALAQKMRAGGARFDFADAAAAGQALIAATRGQLRIGVPFPFSMHAELVHYWLAALNLPEVDRIAIRTVPPPMMGQAIAAGEIDAFCVGEPWGSIAVERGIAELLLPGRAIWARAPEKVLAVRHGWLTGEPDLAARMLRASWRAGRWLDDPANHITAAEIIARPEFLDVPSDVVERALSGSFIISARGEQRQVEDFMSFHRGAASFPWRSQAAWIAAQMARRSGSDPVAAARAAREVFRSDTYRQVLGPAGAELPGASEKLEGAIEAPTAVASASGRLILPADGFFDRRIFDPASIGR